MRNPSVSLGFCSLLLYDAVADRYCRSPGMELANGLEMIQIVTLLRTVTQNPVRIVWCLFKAVNLTVNFRCSKPQCIHSVVPDFRIVRLFGGPVSAPSEIKGRWMSPTMTGIEPYIAVPYSVSLDVESAIMA